MKLNLLPTTVSKQRQSKTAWVIFVVIVLFSILGSAGLAWHANKTLADSKAAADAFKQDAVNAYALSLQADDIIAKAAPIIRNAGLADAMTVHNDVYPKLYDEVKPYIPPFFRITQMSATPLGPDSASMTLTGTINSYQEYTNLVLALMRWKKATSISRAGYVLDEPIVPAISEADQIGRPHKQSEGLVPDDGLERLAYFQGLAQAAPAGYTAVGSFGTSPNETRGAMPGSSLVTVVLSIKENLQVPDIAATLRSAGGGAAAPAAAPASFGPGAPPTGRPGAAGGGGSRGKGEED